MASLLATTAFSAQAVNRGTTLGYSISDVENEDDNTFFDGDIEFLSIGATFDTSSPTSLLGYRGTLSYIAGEYDLDNGLDTGYDGISVDNTICFRVGSGANQRFWAGPAIDVRVVDLDYDETGFDAAVGVGIGGSIGVDFYQQNGQFFSFEGDVRFGATALDADSEVRNDNRDVDLETRGLFIRGSYFVAGGPRR